MKRTIVFISIVFTITLFRQSDSGLIVQAGQNTALPSVEAQRALKDEYCVGCHNDKLKSGGFSWTALDVEHPQQNAALAEKVIRKVRAGMMPPAGARRP